MVYNIIPKLGLGIFKKYANIEDTDVICHFNSLMPLLRNIQKILYHLQIIWCAFYKGGVASFHINTTSSVG